MEITLKMDRNGWQHGKGSKCLYEAQCGTGRIQQGEVGAGHQESSSGGARGARLKNSMKLKPDWDARRVWGVSTRRAFDTKLRE